MSKQKNYDESNTNPNTNNGEYSQLVGVLQALAEGQAQMSAKLDELAAAIKSVSTDTNDGFITVLENLPRKRVGLIERFKNWLAWAQYKYQARRTEQLLKERARIEALLNGTTTDKKEVK